MKLDEQAKLKGQGNWMNRRSLMTVIIMHSSKDVGLRITEKTFTLQVTQNKEALPARSNGTELKKREQFFSRLMVDFVYV